MRPRRRVRRLVPHRLCLHGAVAAEEGEEEGALRAEAADGAVGARADRQLGHAVTVHVLQHRQLRTL